MGVNLRGSFVCTKFAIRLHVQNGGGPSFSRLAPAGRLRTRTHGLQHRRSAIMGRTRVMAAHARHKVRVNFIAVASHGR